MTNTLGNGIALFFGVVIIAVLAAKPKLVQDFFSGMANITRAAVSPVTKG